MLLQREGSSKGNGWMDGHIQQMAGPDLALPKAVLEDSFGAGLLRRPLGRPRRWQNWTSPHSTVFD